jgi:hypothetical protein
MTFVKVTRLQISFRFAAALSALILGGCAPQP